MSDVSASGERRSIRRQRSIYQVHYAIRRRDDMAARPLTQPTDSLDIQAFALQVAGHNKCEDTKYLGLLQCNNGTILKPIIKPAQKREVDFYERLSSTADADLLELRVCAPKYFGCQKYTYNGFEQDYLILEDLTLRMMEPCIMDVKIGRRTWDPLATEEKIKNEQTKYAACKQQYGFCIPGFQVFRLSSGKLCKYNKDYGKKLQGQAVKDAIRTYLNGGSRLCRGLLLQLLPALWRLQRWARAQTAVRLYSASLLLVYDAAGLRTCCHNDDLLTSHVQCRSAPMPRRRHSLHSSTGAAGAAGVAGGSFSGQLCARGPVFRKLAGVRLAPMSLAASSFAPPPPVSSPWTDALASFTHNHSFDHNYEDKLSKIKMDYKTVLDQLSYDSPKPRPWGTVKVIDFAHAFFNEEDERTVDDNFREGIDNFVEIFESFLRETDDQVI